MIKQGITRNSRKEANFVKFIGKYEPKKRENYMKNWIASCNSELLVPFISIHKRGLEVEYQVDIFGITKKGILHIDSPNSIIFWGEKKTKERDRNIKRFIATSESKMLLPYIRITSHDEKFRKIKYEINIHGINDN